MKIRMRFPTRRPRPREEGIHVGAFPEERLFDAILDSLWSLSSRLNRSAVAPVEASPSYPPPIDVDRWRRTPGRARAEVRRRVRAMQTAASEAQRQLAELMSCLPPERWERAALDRLLPQPSLVVALLERAQAAEDEGVEGLGNDSESLALLALHLTHRIDAQTTPAVLLCDSMAEAWVIITRARLLQGRTAGAELAVQVAASLAEDGTGDPLLAYRLHLAKAFTHWTKGERLRASVHLQAAREEAAVLRDRFLLGEAWLWITAFLEACGRNEGCGRTLQRARRLLGARWQPKREELERLRRRLRLPDLPPPAKDLRAN